MKIQTQNTANQLEKINQDIDLKFKYRNSRKIYVKGSRPDIAVPMREILQSDTHTNQGSEPNPPIPVYDTSGLYGDEKRGGEFKARAACIAPKVVKRSQRYGNFAQFV